MPGKKAYPFEASLEKLEAIVETMESGELTLEESLKAFQEGITLTRACQKALSEAQQEVKILMSDDPASIADFDSHNDE
ncbi:MAG: exodeoxyribonuclease VII small subunit [Pseudomonadales bacterium]